MRQAWWSRSFCHSFLLFSVITYQVVIRVKCDEQVAEYRTIDVAAVDEEGRIEADKRISEQDEFSPRTGSLDIRSRYWTMSADEPDYRNQEEPEESAYATIAGDEGDDGVTSDSRSDDGHHAYVTVDRKGKEHLVTINMPRMRMSGKNHIFKKFVIQPVIQYVVQYDKKRQRRREEDEVAAQASTNYGEYDDGQRHERMMQGHEQGVDRYFNDIDAQFETYWGGRNDEGRGNNGGYSSSGGGGGGNSQDGDYDFGDEEGNGGGYATTNQMHQPPDVNAFVSGGGYGDVNDGSNRDGVSDGGRTSMNNGQGHAQNQNQQQNNGQMYGPPPSSMMLAGGGSFGMNMAGQANGFAGSSSGMGGRNSPNSLYGVPGMTPGQPLSSQQMMMSSPGSGGTGGAVGGGGMGQQAMMQGGAMMSLPMGQGMGNAGAGSAAGASLGMGNSVGTSSGIGMGGAAASGQSSGMDGVLAISSGMGGGAPGPLFGMMGSGAQGVSSGSGANLGALSGMIGGANQGVSSGIGSGANQGTLSGASGVAVATSSGMGGANLGTPPGMGGFTLGTSSGMSGATQAASSGTSGAFGPSPGGGGSVSVSTSTAVGNQMEGFAQHLSGMVNNAAAAAGVGAMLMSALSAGGVVAQSQTSGQQSGVVNAIADGMKGQISNGNAMLGIGGKNMGLAHALNNIMSGASGSFGGVGSNIGGVSSSGGGQSSSDGDIPSPAYGPPSPSGGESQSNGGGGDEDDDGRPPRGNRGKKSGGIFGSIGGRGRGKGRRGKNLLSSLPKLPSTIGGHLSFMFSTGFGKGRRGSRSGGGGGGSSKPSDGPSSSDDGNKHSNSKVIDKEQVSDHILTILGLTVHHPPPSKLVGGGGGRTVQLNNSSHTNNPILLWEQQGNSSSLLPSQTPKVTREEVIAHLPVPPEVANSSSITPTQSSPQPTLTPEAETTTTMAMTTEETTDISTRTTSTTIYSTKPPVENVTITTTPPTISPPTSTAATSPLIIAQPHQHQICKPKALSLPPQPPPTNSQTPAIFFTPPPHPLQTLSPVPTMVTVSDQDPLQEYINDNLFKSVVSAPENQQSHQDETSTSIRPNIDAYYADARYPDNPVKLAQFDPWIYDALQAAFQPGHLISDDNIDNGVYFEALKRKRRRRNGPILVDIRKSRSREFYKKESVNKTQSSTTAKQISFPITA